MVEVKDVVQSAIALAGWGLAVYQYVRNERNKRPYVSRITEHARPDEWTGYFVVHNRGPWDVTVEAISATPPQVLRVYRDNRFVAVDTFSYGETILPHASGSFPVFSARIRVLAPPEFSGRVMLSLAMLIKRDTWFSNRVIARHSIQITNK